jgi:3alpha(or 20beta)-hydroxysteroid dehydrogenase
MTAGISEKVYARQPIARIGEPDEIAKLALFLIADATYSTGTEFIADGGATVGQVINV